jgi:hypothetical protein
VVHGLAQPGQRSAHHRFESTGTHQRFTNSQLLGLT